MNVFERYLSLWVAAGMIFVVIPLALGSLSRALLIRRKGAEWFESRLLPAFQPVTIVALLLTLVAIFTTRGWFGEKEEAPPGRPESRLSY